MKSFQYTIKDELGIHARPAGLLVKKAASYQSEISISIGEKKADLKRLFGVMGLGVKCGNEITVTVTGADEDEAAKEIEAFFAENL